MNRFALPRLPTIALKEVLKCLNPIELFELLQCSYKMAQLIPLATTKKISLEIDYDNLKIVMNKSYVLQFRYTLSDIDREVETLVFDLLNVSYTEKVDRLRKLGNHISVLFKCSIKSLEFGYRISSGQCRSIIEKVITTQDDPLENLALLCNLENEDLKWILEMTNVAGKLQVFTDKVQILTDNLQNISVDLKLNCHHFMLDSASWVTVDNLVSLTSCVTIHLLATNLTHQDLQVFMKKWKFGLFPNLEYLLVNSDSLEDDGAVFGFSEEQLRADKNSSRDKIIGDEYYETCAHGVDVTNDDGINGSIQMNSSVFEFFVWKD